MTSRRALIRCDPLTGHVHPCGVCGCLVELVKNDCDNPEDWVLSCACRSDTPLLVPQWCKVDAWNMKNYIARLNKTFRWLMVTELDGETEKAKA